MWNAPLSHGIVFSVATGCALFLFGLSIGLVIAGVCWACIAASDNRQADSAPTSSAVISDEEIEIVIGLVRDALAGGGWTLCGDCYSRQLLQQMLFPVREWEPDTSSAPASCGEPSSTQGVNSRSHFLQHTPDPGKNQRETDLRVEQGEHVGRVAALSQ